MVWTMFPAPQKPMPNSEGMSLLLGQVEGVELRFMHVELEMDGSLSEGGEGGGPLHTVLDGIAMEGFDVVPVEAFEGSAGFVEDADAEVAGDASVHGERVGIEGDEWGAERCAIGACVAGDEAVLP